MNENRKQEIIMATLKLASKKGLGAVSMNMIAEEIGIKKPSIYNHFKSKEELVEQMYQFLRNKAKEKTQGASIDLDKIFKDKTADEILQSMVAGYIKMCSEKDIEMFYKVLYCERTISQVAAKIMIEETEKMIFATKQLFLAMQKQNLLQFEDVEISATSFALTIHALMDYEADKSFSQNGVVSRNHELINNFVSNFCLEHKVKEK